MVSAVPGASFPSAPLGAAPRAVASLPGHPWVLCLFLKQENWVTCRWAAWGPLLLQQPLSYSGE